MRIGRTVLTVLVAGCALSASAVADQPVRAKSGVYTAKAATTIGHPTSVARILANGQVVTPGGNPNAPHPRGAVLGFDNLTCANCAAGLNVSYVQPGAYTSGPNPALSTASLFGLGDGPAGSSLRAPTNATFPNPTDIVWNDYTGDGTVWPGGPDADAAIVEFDHVRAAQNTGAATRTDTCRVLFFTADGLTFKGGFQYTIDIAAGQFFYQRVNVDLSTFDPPLFIARDGLVMIDYPPPAAGQPAVGVGLSFCGGDSVNANYPTPQSLVAVGTCDPTFWVFADGETGDVDHPGGPDPMFDGVDGVSYLDVLNTGALVNWGFTSNNPAPPVGPRTLTSDFPTLFMVTTGVPQLGACVFLSGQTCFITNETDCATQGGQYLGDGTVCGDNAGACCVSGNCSEVLPSICTAMQGTYQGDFTTCGQTQCPTTCPCDFNNSGALNSQDFFDFLTAFFTNAPNADFNHDNVINSQDFFDFLTCFFAPPSGCH